MGGPVPDARFRSNLSEFGYDYSDTEIKKLLRSNQARKQNYEDTYVERTNEKIYLWYFTIVYDTINKRDKAYNDDTRIVVVKTEL